MVINFNSLIETAKPFPVIRTAVVYSITREAIEGLEEAVKRKVIIPILIGPVCEIEKIAQELKVDLLSYEILEADNSQAAAKLAVELVHAGKADMLMKGSLHTDELMRAIIDKDKGLRTEKRMSHIFVVQTTDYHKLLLLTDCALNVSPDLMQKKDIVQNAIEFANAIGIISPKVAILSAVETINVNLKATIDAAALCKMADRGQITNGILDGPLGFDNAISKEAAEIKNITSPVAGNADILLVPDLESGNILAKQLNYLSNAKLAGIIVGTNIPIVLTSRADHAEARLLSCVLGLLYRNYLLQKKICD